ncbi:tail assembly chaperone [Lactobacillus gasseri]|uniref:tail assembly chaperone n=1 Tax=Lactobacillus gasseri TaxID=1596 RepID=UPI00344FED2B
MQIKINDKTYELNFGIRWVLLMNQNHNISGNGINQGMGINQAVASLSQYDPIGLSEILLNATWINKERPTSADIDRYLETDADIKKLCDSILKEIETANATKAQVKNVLKTMKKAQEQAMSKNLEKLG